MSNSLNAQASRERPMVQKFLQPIQAEDLPAEDFRFIQAQQAIYELCKAVFENGDLKSDLQNAKSPETFLKIAHEYGYHFTFSDLQFAIDFALERTHLNNTISDEFDDYELSEEELEMVAGGTATRRAVTNNSYWHFTGILVNQQCFHLLDRSTEARNTIETAMLNMELFVYKGNNQVEAIDLDGQYSSYIIENISYDGLAVGLLQDTSDREAWSNYSSGSIFNLLL
ncbi:MAG TPA: Nif11-like leader peptide family RiPP precursor [Leptolyngbyaceae cyanobacterium]